MNQCVAGIIIPGKTFSVYLISVIFLEIKNMKKNIPNPIKKLFLPVWNVFIGRTNVCFKIDESTEAF